MERSLGVHGSMGKTKLVSFKDAFWLIVKLEPSSQFSAETHENIAHVFARYPAGDPLLAAQIDRNFRSNDAIHRLARAALLIAAAPPAGDEVVGDAAPAFGDPSDWEGRAVALALLSLAAENPLAPPPVGDGDEAMRYAAGKFLNCAIV